MITVKEFAEKLGMTTGGLHQALYRHPEYYPTYHQFTPGKRSPLKFNAEEVDKWIAEHQKK